MAASLRKPPGPGPQAGRESNACGKVEIAFEKIEIAKGVEETKGSKGKAPLGGAQRLPPSMGAGRGAAVVPPLGALPPPKSGRKRNMKRKECRLAWKGAEPSAPMKL